jgi:hypothetical protein
VVANQGCPTNASRARGKRDNPKSLKLSADRRPSIGRADLLGVVDELQPAERVQPPELRAAG